MNEDEKRGAAGGVAAFKSTRFFYQTCVWEGRRENFAYTIQEVFSTAKMLRNPKENAIHDKSLKRRWRWALHQLRQGIRKR